MHELARFVTKTRVVETVAGADEAMLSEFEQHRGYRLPACYRAFLQTFGNTNTHGWFDSAYTSIDRFDETLEVVQDLIAEGLIPWLDDPLIIPFTHHTGSIIYYLRRDDGDDPAVFCAISADETTPAERSQLAPAFSIWLRNSAFDAIERQSWPQAYITYIRQPNATVEEQSKLVIQHMQEYAKLYADFSAQLYQADIHRHQLTSPWDFLNAWVGTFRQSDLYRRMQTLNMPIPLGWVRLTGER
ncbi:SMI1/KNR4 family protein [Herpetosiphon llansteffanensis]|uniref:SMI1/KNR4 family protein n=1 Tax=Herpetosiphon llansteffanensis TaxID=2094568 RepID=UPI0013E04975|nr:SMI1/KNR4 family protein [Herpetosiphon llansteffanensis]